MRGFAAATILTACASSTIRVPPERIASAEATPRGYEELGYVVASCQALDGFQATAGEPLSSFDCERVRLERVLAERASAVSAEMLVGTSCGRNGSVLRCTAMAARAETASARARPSTATDPGPVPGPRAIERWDEPRAGAALAIRVDFEPSVSHFERKKRAAADVAEVRALPVSHRGLGTMTTRCDADECELGELRQALRIAAGGLGASDLVDVRCFGRNDVRECVADVAASEVDE
jgi:hypothetical protein